MIEGTPAAADYSFADILIQEQKAVRWRSKQTTQPFWANYWCGRDSRCQCRIPGSKALESDAIFFLRNERDRVLAIHVEFKHPKEAFGFGQPEAYPLRAECWSQTYRDRKTVNPHHQWTTVLFCGSDTLNDPRVASFQRVIMHAQAAEMISTYPRLTT
ncbi:hypothetical protein [Methylobacterium terrae]|uniref:hypothetical protein n=1 Tax=Methylobacterium terrae TaxID=2202827 RepID=UPI0013A58A57|nr:hypothetical protein [Methylobacterium terrae]